MYLRETLIAIKRARKPLLQLSGGRDSLCALFVLIECGCTDFDVAWLNTGDAPDETINRMDDIKLYFGNRFHEINSDSTTVRAQYGLPSPMVRAEDTHQCWKDSSTAQTGVQHQLDCCAKTIMLPAHEFVVANGYDLVIRGNRQQDTMRTPVDHLTDTGAEYILAYPIYNWSSTQVNDFLQERELLPSFYEFMDSGIDCLTCPAFWGNGHQAWLEHHYPEKAPERRHQIEKLMEYLSHTIQLGFNELDSRSVTQ